MSAESLAFYSTAAQVLPVLFLAIVFEQGIWRGDAKRASHVFGIDTGTLPRGRFATAVLVFIVLLPLDLFIGEWLALRAVGGNEAGVASYFVTGALVIAGILVILPPLWIALPGLLPERAVLGALDFTLARVVIVALAIGSAAFTLLGVLLALF